MKRSVALTCLALCLFVAACAPINQPTEQAIQPPAAQPIIEEATPSAAPTETLVPPTLPVPTATLAATSTIAPVVETEGELSILYSDDLGVWRWRQGAEPQLLLESHANHLFESRDGRLIVACLDRAEPVSGCDIWVLDRDGSNARELMKAEAVDALYPDLDAPVVINQIGITPDASLIYFSTATADYGSGEQFDLWLLDTQTAQLRQVAPNGLGGWFNFSPDGQWMMLKNPGSISVGQVGSDDFRLLLSFPIVYTYSEWNYSVETSWSADSQGIYALIPPQEWDNPDQETIAYYLPVDGSQPEALFSYSRLADLPHDSFSPDHSWLVYHVRAEDPHIFELRLHALDGSNEDLLISSGQSNMVQWLPDSQRFIYYEINLQYTVISGINGEKQQWTHEANPFALEWIDENSFLYRVIDVDSSILKIGDLTGTAEVITDRGWNSYWIESTPEVQP